MKTTITKEEVVTPRSRRAVMGWVVRGAILCSERAGRSEAVEIAFRTRAEAEREAAKIDRINADSREWLAMRRAMRLQNARAYLAKRAARNGAEQLKLL